MGQEVEEIEKLRAFFDEQLKNKEEENTHLLLSLDEVIVRDREKQLQLYALEDEAEELRARVSFLEHREDEWEEDDELRVGLSEWEKEKSSFLHEISKLHQSINDGDEIIEGLKDQLHTCKQALDYEEKHTKNLQFKVSEIKTLLENECPEANSVEECSETDFEKSENLRNSVHVKEKEFKDMQYRIKILEIENQQLLVSIQDAQTQKVPSPQLTKVRSKLKALEKTHQDCTNNLKAVETEWSSQAQKMSQELSRCISNLKAKDQVIEDLKKELDACHSSLTQLKLQNEELSSMSQSTRPEVSDAQSILHRQEQDNIIMRLMQQVTLKNISLSKAQNDLQKEHEEKIVILRELERCTEMLEESSDCQLDLMEQAADLERKLTEELQEVYDELERLETELADKITEGTELEYELQSCQSANEHWKKQFDETLKMRRVLEKSIIAQVETEEKLRREIEDKDRRIGNLEQQIFLFDEEIRIEEEEEEEESVPVKIVKVPQQLQRDGDDHIQQGVAKKEPEKTTGARVMDTHEIANYNENLLVSRESSQNHVRSPQHIAALKRESPHDIENLPNLESMRRQSSQEAEVARNPSSQEFQELHNPHKIKVNIEGPNSEYASKQSSQHVKEVQNTEVATDPSSQEVHELQNPDKSKVNIVGHNCEFAGKQSSQNVKQVEKTEVTRNPSSQEVRELQNPHKSKMNNEGINSDSVGKQSSRDVKEVQKTDFASNPISQEVRELQNPHKSKVNVEDLNSESAGKHSSQDVKEVKKPEVERNPSSQEVPELQNPQKINVNIEGLNNDCVAKRSLQDVKEVQKTEVASKQSSPHGDSSQQNHMENKQGSEKTNSRASENSEKDESLEPDKVAINHESETKSEPVKNVQKSEVSNKHSSQDVDNNVVGNNKQGLDQTNQQLKMGSQHFKGSQKAEYVKHNLQPTEKKDADKQSSHQVNEQSTKLAGKQGSRNIETSQQVKVTNKQAPEVSKKFEEATKKFEEATKKFVIAGKHGFLQGKNDAQTQQEIRRPIGKIGKMIQGFESGKKRIEVEGEICVTNEDKSKKNPV